MAETKPPAQNGEAAPLDVTGETYVHSALPYVLVWIALCVFTGVTVITGKMHLGAWALPLALAIATTKSVLVLLFFMHLWEQKGANRMVVAMSFVFVLLLMGLTLSDVATRFRPLSPAGAPVGSKVELPEGAARR